MKIGYGTHSGIHNVLFEGNRVDFAGVAIKVSSHLGWVSIHNYQPVASLAFEPSLPFPCSEGGTLRNLSFYNTVVRQTGIGINVDLGTYVRQSSFCVCGGGCLFDVA